MLARPVWCLLLPLLAMGCATQAHNPSFPLTVRQADDALADMAEDVEPLPRPVVIVGGYLDFIGAALVRNQYAKIAPSGAPIISVSLFACGDFDDCRSRIIDAVDHAFPSADANFTAEVDVIGISMGGVAARYASIPDPAGKHPRRLNIARLFTISSPHQGAILAQTPSLLRLHRDMRSGSAFLAALDAASAQARYPIYPYVRLDDRWVGEENAAPRGRVAWWVPNPPLEDAHMGAAFDPRIRADIARRLRGEPPFTTEPPAALPF